MFNQNSALVKAWWSGVMTGAYRYTDVPNLSNLRDQVKIKLEAAGYDVAQENAA